MNKDEYEFVPVRDFNQVEHDLNKIKHNPFIDKEEGKELAHSIDSLQSSINDMLGLFKKANEELTLEQREAKIIQEQLQPVQDKLKEFADQNETIANGIITVADSVNELKQEMTGIKRLLMQIDMKLGQKQFSTPQQRSTPVSPPFIPPMQPNGLNQIQQKGSFFQK